MKKIKKNESGRSMVEMLGVLAIIGVLSVGGIAGYRMAMNKHHANEWLNDFNLFSIEVKSQWERRDSFEDGKSIELNDFGFYSWNQIVPGRGRFPEFNTQSIKNADVCKQILESYGEEIFHLVGGHGVYSYCYFDGDSDGSSSQYFYGSEGALERCSSSTINWPASIYCVY